jgi:hypothetical protein
VLTGSANAAPNGLPPLSNAARTPADGSASTGNATASARRGHDARGASRIARPHGIATGFPSAATSTQIPARIGRPSPIAKIAASSATPT